MPRRGENRLSLLIGQAVGIGFMDNGFTAFLSLSSMLRDHCRGCLHLDIREQTIKLLTLTIA